MCEHPQVYVRACLINPFIVVSNSDGKTAVDEDDDPEFEHFVKEKSELFVLVFCIMLQNLDTFTYLWNKCAYLWTDLHLALLLNYLFESQWEAGLHAVLTSQATHQLLAAMSHYERTKLLAFVHHSASSVAEFGPNPTQK
jgi:hypothetical protein